MVHVNVFIFFYLFIDLVCGHGRLWEPPSRSSMWRKGFNTPKNYNDNELFCGGFNHQWNVNKGKCGICGDPYDGERKNEGNGTYATGTISASYESGAEINITVELTAHHKGWFEFRLCPHNNPAVAANQSCLDNYKLQLADGNGTSRYTLDLGKGMKTQTWKLPDGLVCSQCVLQWKYHTGNSWGVDDDGHGCVGCGPQEEFYGCADIAITSTGMTTTSTFVPTTTTTTPTSAITTTPTTSAITTTPTTSATMTTLTTSTTTNPPTISSTTTTPASTSATTTTPTSTSATPTTTITTNTTDTSTTTTTSTTTLILTTILQTTQGSTTGSGCRPTSAYESTLGMTQWCITNCAAGYCPATHCTCT